MCGYLEIPLHLSLHCPFQCAFLMLHWFNTSGLMSLAMTALGDLCANTIPGGDFGQGERRPGDHMSSSSSSSWEEPACWAALADAAAICACWAACCICSHSCWASSACCCRACSNTVRPKQRRETTEELVKRLQKDADDETNYVIRHEKNYHDTQGWIIFYITCCKNGLWSCCQFSSVSAKWKCHVLSDITVHF